MLINFVIFRKENHYVGQTFEYVSQENYFYFWYTVFNPLHVNSTYSVIIVLFVVCVFLLFTL